MSTITKTKQAKQTSPPAIDAELLDDKPSDAWKAQYAEPPAVAAEIATIIGRAQVTADIAEEYCKTRNPRELRVLRREMVRLFKCVYQTMEDQFDWPRSTWSFLRQLEEIAKKLRQPNRWNLRDNFWESSLEMNPNVPRTMLPVLLETLTYPEPPLPQPRREPVPSLAELEAQGLSDHQIAKLFDWKTQPTIGQVGGPVADHFRVMRCRMGQEPWPEYFEIPAQETSGWPREQPTMEEFMLLYSEMLAGNAVEITGADQNESQE